MPVLGLQHEVDEECRNSDQVLCSYCLTAGGQGVIQTLFPGEEVGSALGKVALDALAGTEATSFDDFYGRLVLLEFFAYW